MTQDDNREIDNRQNLFDLHHIVASLEIALEALRKDMEGLGADQRDQFTFQIGYAVGRLSRVQERIYKEDPHAP
jgi:hypothetical protein